MVIIITILNINLTMAHYIHICMELPLFCLALYDSSLPISKMEWINVMEINPKSFSWLTYQNNG